MPARSSLIGATLLLAACEVSGVVGVDMAETDSLGTTGGSTTTADDTAVPVTSDPTFDIGSDVDLCVAEEEQDEYGECKLAGPPEAFEPRLLWSWSGIEGYRDTYVTPLVANLTDDNADGAVDLCDTPDVVVLASPHASGGNLGLDDARGRLFLLDGRDGTSQGMIDYDLVRGYTPAIGDVDNDGLAEIVAVADGGGGADPLARIVVLSADGAVEVEGQATWVRNTMGAVALADIDIDGDPEIIVDHVVLDVSGRLKLESDRRSANPLLPIAADLVGDGRLEVIWGHDGARADGTPLWGDRDNLPDGYPHVADFNRDGQPEILLTTGNGLMMLAPDGSVLHGPETPNPLGTLPDPDVRTWRRPAAIHNIDDDPAPEILMSVGEFFLAIEYDATGFSVRWQQGVTASQDDPGATAFDFLGDGQAEAAFGDQNTLWLYDLSGRDVLMEPRASITVQELPVVADVDNDGSAEIVVGSNQTALESAPMISVWGEELSRWVPARRIWNQHTYHVTNIEENGAIPRAELSIGRGLNTFRTNAQIEGGLICTPPEG